MVQPVPPHGSNRPHGYGRDAGDDDVQGHVLPGRTQPAVPDEDVEGHKFRRTERPEEQDTAGHGRRLIAQSDDDTERRSRRAL